MVSPLCSLFGKTRILIKSVFIYFHAVYICLPKRGVAFGNTPFVYSATAEADDNSKRDKDYPQIAVVKSVA